VVGRTRRAGSYRAGGYRAGGYRAGGYRAGGYRAGGYRHGPRLIALIAAMLLLPVLVGAETLTSVVLDLGNIILINPDPDGPEAKLVPAGLGTIKINSVGNQNVRAYLQLSADLGISYALAVDRAYLRTRFETMRLTLGKTRLSWGEGLVFNAADVLMGSADTNVNFSAEEYRSESAWLAAAYLPLGRFSFIEAVVMPPQIVINPLDPASMDPSAFPPLSDSGAGLRVGFQLESLGDMAIETGYYYAGERDDHSAYLSLQGGAGINFHLSASMGLPTGVILDGPDGDDLLDGLLVSGGLYGLPDIGRRFSLSLRSELLYRPGAPFQAEADRKDYGLFAFAEASLGIDQLATVYLRSILSPVDASALIYAGTSFALYQGFSLYADLSAQAGEASDVFPNRELGGYALRTGVRFVY
jgi:hypothetical protein